MIYVSEEEKARAERNEASLTALFEQMGRNVPTFIKHVAESMAMSTTKIREQDRWIREILAEDRKEKRRAAQPPAAISTAR